MKTKNQKTILMERITALQQQQTQDFHILKEQYYITLNSFSTLNILKSSIQEVISTPNLTSDIIHGTVKMGTQYLSKAFLNTNPVQFGLLSKVVQFALKKWRNR